MNCNIATPPTPHCRTAGRGGTVVAQNEMRPAALERPDLVAHFNGKRASDNEQRQDYGRRDPRARGERVSAPVRQGIPTVYRGVLMRSRTEARWAALFDRFGWAWTYEPADLPLWLPDFAIHFDAGDLMVEVKATEDDFALAESKVETSGYEGPVLIVGHSVQRNACGRIRDWGSGVAEWCDAEFFVCGFCESPSVLASEGDWRCRACGRGYGRAHVHPIDADEHWAAAANLTQWRPRA